MAHFDAALDGQDTLTIGRGVTGHHVADVGHQIGLGQIAAPIHAGHVKVFGIRAADPVGHDGHFQVGHHFQRLLQVHRAQVAGFAAKVRVNFSQGGKAKAFVKAGQLAHFHLVHVVVAAHQQQPNLRLQHLALVVQVVGGQHQGFDSLRERQAQQHGHIGAGAFARRGGFGHGLVRRWAWLLGCECLRFFHVGGVVAVGAIDDGVFASGGHHLKFLGQIAANGAAVGGHGTVLQAEAVKDATVSLRHVLVAELRGCTRAVKAVGVFHDELAATHEAKAGAAFVTEFGLDLVEIFRQLLVAAQLLAGDVGHHFFAGGLNHEVAAMAVFDAQQLGAHFLEAPGFLPQLGGLHHRHGQLHRHGTVHFLAHDGFDLANDAQAHGHVGVDASTQFFDHARTHHQLMAGHFSVGRGFFEGGDEEL